MRRLARAQLARPPQDTQFKLEASGMKAASLHGEMSKMERQQVLAKFRAGGYSALTGNVCVSLRKFQKLHDAMLAA
jgi:superfamily II DNA or RNA helicase